MYLLICLQRRFLVSCNAFCLFIWQEKRDHTQLSTSEGNTEHEEEAPKEPPAKKSKTTASTSKIEPVSKFEFSFSYKGG